MVLPGMIFRRRKIMAKRTLNFDNFMEEKTQEPIMVTVFGKEYPVKPKIPAIVMVNLARTNDSTISDSDAARIMLKAGDQLFGEEAMNEFCAKGMDADQIINLIKMVFEVINGKDIDGDDVEELDDESGMVATGEKAKK